MITVEEKDIETLEALILKDIAVRNITLQKLETKLIGLHGDKARIVKQAIIKQQRLIEEHFNCIKKIRKLGE